MDTKDIIQRALSAGNHQTMAIAAVASAISDLAAAHSKVSDINELNKIIVMLIDMILEWRNGAAYDPEIDNVLKELGVELK